MMGSSTTSTRDLEQVGQKLFEPSFFGGVHAGNSKERHGHGTKFWIENTMDRPPGQHWVGCYRENGNTIIFDSFGREPASTNDLRLFVGMQTTELDAEQPISTDPKMQYCGQACLSFGMVCHKFGMVGARKI